MIKKASLLITVMMVLLAFIGTVGAAELNMEDKGITTNVLFCKLIESGESRWLVPLPTHYMGINDYGRHTFITGAQNLTDGNYMIVQKTQNGTELIQYLKLEKKGDVNPVYTLLKLELHPDELPEPLQVVSTIQTDPTHTIAPPADHAVPSAEAAAPLPTTATPVANQSPVSPLMVLAGVGTAGLLCALRIHR